jgi:hypothetical protein
MLFRLITFLFIIGIIFRVLFRFILPLFHVTSTASSRIRQMQDQMRDMESKMNQNNNTNSNTPKPRGKKDGDYIDYEEVKS